MSPFVETFQPSLRRRLRDTDRSMTRWWQEPREEVPTTHTQTHTHGHTHTHTYGLTPSLGVSELKEAQRKKRQMKERIRQEESIASAMVIWNNDILPHWETM